MKLSKGGRLILLALLLVVIDQVIKVLVKTNMELGEQIMLIGQWCRLCFIENEGMAFGMAFGGDVGKLLLSLFRIVLSGLLIWWISRLLRTDPNHRRSDRQCHRLHVLRADMGLCPVHVRQGG